MNIDTGLSGRVRVPVNEPHEMLSVRRADDGKYEVRINYSSLDIIQTCKRKAYFALKRGLRANVEGAATIFGSSIHRALETWYCAPRSERANARPECDDSQANMLIGREPIPHGECVRCASVFAFLERGRELTNLPENDKRSLRNGIVILNNYFDHYARDPFVVYADAYGPVAERKFEFVMHEDDHLRIVYFGTIDVVLENTDTGVVLICDHKSTSALGTEFFQRLKPNFQYTGYVMGAQRALGIPTNMFLANGIQVAKTVRGLSRQIVQVSEEDFAELRLAVDHAVSAYLACERDEEWPMSAPTSCTLWAGCTYREVCCVPKTIRENVIAALYASNTISGV